MLLYFVRSVCAFCLLYFVRSVCAFCPIHFCQHFLSCRRSNTKRWPNGGCRLVIAASSKQYQTSCYSQQTQNICITFVQRRCNVFDVGPALYKCYTNVLYLLSWTQFSKHEALNQCWFDAGPASQMVGNNKFCYCIVSTVHKSNLTFTQIPPNKTTPRNRLLF